MGILLFCIEPIYFIELYTWMHYICWLCIFIAMAVSTVTLPHSLYGRVMRNVNKNDCVKSLRVGLLYGEFDNVPELSRLLVSYRGDIN